MSRNLVLPSELTIYTVAEIYPQWMAWLTDDLPAIEAEGKAATVEASGVDEVDGAGLQMLMALSGALVARRHGLRLDCPSRPLRDACHALGVQQLLGDEQPDVDPAAPSSGEPA